MPSKYISNAEFGTEGSMVVAIPNKNIAKEKWTAAVVLWFTSLW